MKHFTSSSEKSVSLRGEIWRLFKKSKINRLGLLIISLMALVAILAPFLANSTPLYLKMGNRIYFPILGKIYPLKKWVHYSDLQEIDLEDPGFFAREDVVAHWPPIPYSPSQYNLDEILEPPSGRHWLGTDNQGRDVAGRMVYGSRISLSVGFVAVGLTVALGIFFGACAGYFGGGIDLLVSRLIEVIMCFPTLFLILTLLAFIGPSIYTIMMVIGATGWTGIARLVRGEVLKNRERDYVMAARARGARWYRIVFRHILPNSLAPIFVSATFGVASAVLLESSLSFLGLGVEPSTPSWGDILRQSREFMDIAWWLTLFPGLAIFLTITSYNIVGEGLRDAMDPRLKG